MDNTDKLKEDILTAIDRYVKLCEILGEKIDQEYIDKLTDQFIELLKEDIKKYQ